MKAIILNYRNLTLLAVLLFLAACGQKKDQANGENTLSDSTQIVTETPQNCTYSYDSSEVTISWTAYKFTEKTGVNGKFRSVKVNTSNGAAQNVTDLLNNLTFEIPIEGVDTNDPERDKKIKTYFFGTLKETEVLRGSFTKVEGNDQSGTATILLKMNNLEKEVPLSYEVNAENVLRFTGDIDVNLWEGMAAINALNEVCKDLHTGKDGISKLWSEVSLNISAKLMKNCE
ncbi:YceI family protein [Hugenholtzia roseola]|uniref:YceI family protein n=1 Tax=Hugenholtzia roseola TaxID=1002 RepID=UPI000415447E|nr:YceI family protein [Hugenholtzia roseola]